LIIEAAGNESSDDTTILFATTQINSKCIRIKIHAINDELWDEAGVSLRLEQGSVFTKPIIKTSCPNGGKNFFADIIL
jgi:hypothetical protein